VDPFRIGAEFRDPSFGLPIDEISGKGVPLKRGGLGTWHLRLCLDSTRLLSPTSALSITLYF
jgi:hypothetical protein